MKILIVNKFFYPKGGSETYMFSLSALLRQAGHQVMEFSMQSEKNLPAAYSQYFIKPIDFNKKEGLLRDLVKACHLLYSTEAKKKLEQLIQKERPDIAHLHNFNFQLTPSILRVFNKYNIPVVWTLHDYKVICPNYRLFTQGAVCERCKVYKYYNCFTHKCLKNSWSLSFLAMLEMYLHKMILRSYGIISCYIAPSKFLAAKVLDWQLPKNKIKQSYYCLDLAKFKPAEAVGDGLVYVGRLVEEKGILTLLEAMKQMPGINLKIAGAGSQMQEIERLIESSGLANVQLVGHKSGQELINLVSQAKLVIEPSVWYENNPLAILEAFALGKPVIGSALGGIPELVKDGQTGYLFKPGSASDLAQNIKNFYYNDELILQMGKNCRIWVEKNCEPQKHLEEILKIYNEVLK
jgi:glycosyltransferase involved in cell wall biosynthesis